MAFVFANSNSNLVAYLASITGGTHVLNTKLQREFTKSYKWKSDMIFYMMWVGEVPGKIYFHPVESEDGVIIQESLDGKSRTSAPDEFMRGVFKLDDEFKVKGFERLYGKYYHEFTAADQSRFKTTKVSIAEADRTLSHNESTIFFRFIKTPSDCKTGEGLHSDLESPNRTKLDQKMATDPDFKEFITTVWGKDKRFPYYTIIAYCMMYREFGPKKSMKNEELALYWRTGVSQMVFDEITKNMQKVWKLKKDRGAKIKRIESATVFCPFFMLYSDSVSDAKIKKILDNWKEDEQFGINVGGNHNIVSSRYQVLLEMSV
jgi:hypothetical protein